MAELARADATRLVLHLRGAVSIEEPVRSSRHRPPKELLADRSAEGPLRSLIRRDLASRLRERARQIELRVPLELRDLLWAEETAPDLRSACPGRRRVTQFAAIEIDQLVPGER